MLESCNNFVLSYAMWQAYTIQIAIFVVMSKRFDLILLNCSACSVWILYASTSETQRRGELRRQCFWLSVHYDVTKVNLVGLVRERVYPAVTPETIGLISFFGVTKALKKWRKKIPTFFYTVIIFFLVSPGDTGEKVRILIAVTFLIDGSFSNTLLENVEWNFQ